MKRKFKVLYTHQKLKKRKTWQDGLLTLREDQRRGFLGDDANKQLATVFLNKKKVANGDELECDKYLIQVEEEVLNENEQNDECEKDELVLSSPACVRVQDPSTVGQVRRKFTVPRQKEVVCVAPVEQRQPHEKEIMTSPSIWSSVDDGIGEGIRTIQSAEKTSSDCSRSSTVRGTGDLLKLLSGKVANPVINKESENVSDLSSNEVFPSEDHRMFSTAKNLVEFKNNQETRSKWQSPRCVQPRNNVDAIDECVGTSARQLELQCRLKKELFFPSSDDLKLGKPSTSTLVSCTFASVEEYVRTWTEVVHEHLNLLLWAKSESFHTAMKNADISTYLRGRCADEDPLLPPDLTIIPPSDEDAEMLSSTPPLCNHDAPSKLARVRKEGPNKGRLFFTCAVRKSKCKFFKWADAVQVNKSLSMPNKTRCNQITRINNSRALCSYLGRNGILLFVNSKLCRKLPNIKDKDKPTLGDARKQMVLKLSRTDKSLMQIKDSLWVVSKTFDFTNVSTFVLKVVSNTISSSHELIVQPLSSHVELNDEDAVHAIFVGKTSKEFLSLQNLQKKVPHMILLPYLLNGNNPTKFPAGLNLSTMYTQKRSDTLKPAYRKSVIEIPLEYNDMLSLASDYIEKYKLNDEQSAAFYNFVDILKDKGKTTCPVLLINGVAASGKTFLLAIFIVFIHQLREKAANQIAAECEESNSVGHRRKSVARWKVLVCSTSNSTIDSLLQFLLHVGFQEFARVGNLLEVAAKLLPYSVPRSGGSEEHSKILKELHRRCDKCSAERHYIQKSLKLVESGATKRLLHNAFVVATTCQDSLLPSIGYYKFPIVVMDNAHDVPEPLALLPLAHFGCEKLLLAGDSLSTQSLSNQNPFGNSLFNRLELAGNEAIILTSQYRFHPSVTSLMNAVFYNGKMRDGVCGEERSRLVEGLPNLCFYDVPGVEVMTQSDDYSNTEEAKFIADLITLLLSRGVPGAGIAVMTTYDAQVKEVTSAFEEINFYDVDEVNCVKVTSWDKNKHGEKDVVIYSNARTCGSQGQSDRDLIGLLTRARNHVIIVANMRHLSTNEKWSRVICEAKRRIGVIQSSFHFRKFFANNVARTGNDVEKEIPFRATNFGLDDVDPLLRQEGLDEDSDQSDENFEKKELCHENDNLNQTSFSEHDDVKSSMKSELRDVEISSASDNDDIPLLRHRRKGSIFVLSESDLSQEMLEI
ncbi:unnamed protein product [Clavelina lepadiformis]|uniref:GRF-type domain-containing protein n=1 Tax=Clavelina lepadiformis TaxID=159417 RepID=A0ABP0FJ78_CLALP